MQECKHEGIEATCDKKEEGMVEMGFEDRLGTSTEAKGRPQFAVALRIATLASTCMGMGAFLD